MARDGAGNDLRKRYRSCCLPGNNADRGGMGHDQPDTQGRNPTGEIHIRISQHGISMPQREAARHGRNNHLRKEGTDKPGGPLRDRGA